MSLYRDDKATNQYEEGSSALGTIGDVASEPAKRKLREKAVEYIRNAIAESVAAGTTSSFASLITPILIIVMVMCIVPLCLLSVNYVYEKEADTVLNRVEDAVREAFDDVKKDPMILNEINSHFPCKFTKSDLSYGEDGSISMVNDICEVYVNFLPGLDDIVPAIAAYTTAVNGTITYYIQDVKEIDPYIQMDHEGNVVGYDTSDLPDINDASNYVVEDGVDENGMIQYKNSDLAQGLIESGFNTDTTNADTHDFENEIRRHSKDFFELEKNYDLWKNNTISEHQFEKKRDVCMAKTKEGDEKIVNMSWCEDEYPGYYMGEETYYVDGYLGSVTIPIYFDLTPYKADELDQSVQALYDTNRRCVWDMENGKLTGSETCEMEEASRTVSATMHNYYETTLQYFNVDLARLAYIYGGSYAGSYDGSYDLSNIPNGEMLVGSLSVFAPDFSNSKYWKHSSDGGTNNLSYGQCTWFAYGMFYQIHGYAPNRDGSHLPDGGDWATSIHLDGWSASRSPTPGSIASVKTPTRPHGTVAMVLAVNEDGTMTLAHGNANANLSEDPWGYAVNDWYIETVNSSTRTFSDGSVGQWTFLNPPG